ncbi:hypothetical protein KABACHOK_00880 [Brevundimonas phage vB_BpoS-Kabachok]|uniref:Uncharacterized protein n=1 Tax=Brevundimonas phage vB_BpoS-Kabachok TaxID=2948600 RepID=A0A9E7MPZ2_9CAUD|nr:hypothetical protein KABACHOK_00880 [Brevundimonas phage vB_BpoS-Kabachok]
MATLINRLSAVLQRVADEFNTVATTLSGKADKADTYTKAEVDALSGGVAVWTAKTGTYTAVDGDRILADTSEAAWTLTLPEAGAFVEVADPIGAWATNALTVKPVAGEALRGVAGYLICDQPANLQFQKLSGGVWLVRKIALVPGKPPISIDPPVITGSAWVGETLTALAGAWENAPTQFSWRWYANGVVIAGATASTYTVAQADVGKAISVRVTATNGDGATTAVSVATSQVPKSQADWLAHIASRAPTFADPNRQISNVGAGTFRYVGGTSTETSYWGTPWRPLYANGFAGALRSGLIHGFASAAAFTAQNGKTMLFVSRLLGEFAQIDGHTRNGLTSATLTQAQNGGSLIMGFTLDEISYWDAALGKPMTMRPSATSNNGPSDYTHAAW